MNYKCIDYSIEHNIARITLNRPETGNTLNVDLAKELYKATSTIATNSNVKVLILTAKGKLFCGGGDLKFLLSKQDKVKETLLEMTHYFHGAIARMARMDAIVIIGINGTAGGGGFSLAITGDIIYSVKSAKFTLAYTNAGLSPDGSSTFFLPRIVGIKRAKELMLTNRVLSADDAKVYCRIFSIRISHSNPPKCFRRPGFGFFSGLGNKSNLLGEQNGKR